MSKTTIIVSCPIDTYSGYGARSRDLVKSLMKNPEYDVKDRLLTTWFPAFRANYEVSQIAEGGKVSTVLWSSIRVKFYACLIMLCGMAILPLIIDVNKISNEEGLLSVLVVAAISMTVGISKLRKRF